MRRARAVLHQSSCSPIEVLFVTTPFTFSRGMYCSMVNYQPISEIRRPYAPPTYSRSTPHHAHITLVGGRYRLSVLTLALQSIKYQRLAGRRN